MFFSLKGRGIKNIHLTILDLVLPSINLLIEGNQ